jgi:uncharacterized membrane protein
MSNPFRIEFVPTAGAIASARAVTQPALTGARARLDSIDLLRGAVIVLMALDHVRDFFAAGGFNPRDVNEPALFLTRWATHFCAPVFVFLAGVSAFLYGTRGKTTAEVSRFLWTRGLWLVILELTVVRFGWTFSFYPDLLTLQVIWAIGVSMIVLSGLVYLPRWLTGALAISLIVGHNLLDSIDAGQLGAFGWIWNILHEPAMLDAGSGITVFALYPLIPWIGVMAAGYAFGPVVLFGKARRRRWLLALGAAVTLGFVLLRASNAYGDPAPWTVYDDVIATALSFINNEKYPPSALYLAMTLGPGLLLLAGFDSAKGRLARFFVTFGRVPLTFYLAHLLLIHSAAVIFATLTLGDVSWLFRGLPIETEPAGYRLGLAGVYVVWLAVIVALYPLCRGFAQVKQRRNDWWLSYL